MTHTCPCGQPATIRFSRVKDDAWVRLDRCGECAEIKLRAINDGPPVAWRVEDLADEVIAEHARVDARASTGRARGDLHLLSFGSW